VSIPVLTKHSESFNPIANTYSSEMLFYDKEPFQQNSPVKNRSD